MQHVAFATITVDDDVGAMILAAARCAGYATEAS